jgi:hypothetical protein
MKATWLFRVAAVAFLLFAAGHTLGFLTFRAPTPEGRAVFDAMHQVHFTVGNTEYSYGNFYLGFGLSCSVAMLFSAFLAWHLGTLARGLPQAIGALGWVFFAVQVAGVLICLKYFGVPQVAFSLAVAVCIGAASCLVHTRQIG